ncbi:MAG: hypothetical protein Q9204_003118 [Flavoplaca sp. TL-2023a]
MLYSYTLLALAAAAYALPQAVTDAISPSASPPPGCTPSLSGTYGIAVQTVSNPAVQMKRQVSQIDDGQPQVKTMAPITMASDGQPQAGTTMMFMAAQIGDGQVQAQTTTYAPVTIISDGQPQAPTLPTPTTTSTEVPVSQIDDAQPQAPFTAAPTPGVESTYPASSTPQRLAMADTPDVNMVACESEGTLAITLDNGILKDAQGRTGYIASNFQFQFDGPPQAGAIYTSGFSACENGTLALGGSNVFYQCLSGDFYNLYDRDWAPQCSAITINLLQLQSCPAESA